LKATVQLRHKIKTVKTFRLIPRKLCVEPSYIKVYKTRGKSVSLRRLLHRSAKIVGLRFVSVNYQRDLSYDLYDYVPSKQSNKQTNKEVSGWVKRLPATTHRSVRHPAVFAEGADKSTFFGSVVGTQIPFVYSQQLRVSAFIPKTSSG